MNNWLFWLLVLFQIADAASTWYIVRNELGRESNPIMGFWMHRLGLVPGLVLPKAIMLIAIWWFIVPLSYSFWILIMMITLYAIVLISNVYVARDEM